DGAQRRGYSECGFMRGLLVTSDPPSPRLPSSLPPSSRSRGTTARQESYDVTSRRGRRVSCYCFVGISSNRGRCGVRSKHLAFRANARRLNLFERQRKGRSRKPLRIHFFLSGTTWVDIHLEDS